MRHPAITYRHSTSSHFSKSFKILLTHRVSGARKILLLASRSPTSRLESAKEIAIVKSGEERGQSCRGHKHALEEGQEEMAGQ